MPRRCAMGDKPPFDPVRASFLLIAAILGVQCLVVLIGVVACAFYIHTIMTVPEVVCDSKGRLTELLTSALAAALAFAGGMTRNK